MSKLVSLAIPLVVLVAVGSVFATLEARRVPDWRIELDQYIASRWPPTATVRVRSVAPARRPWNYGPEMGRPVANDGVWNATELPFPPRRVICVLLEREPPIDPRAWEPTYQLAFVCHHSDALWKVGWVVHEGRGDPFSGAVQERMSTLGCDLGLAQFKPERSRPPRARPRGPDRAHDLEPLVIHLPGNS